MRFSSLLAFLTLGLSRAPRVRLAVRRSLSRGVRLVLRRRSQPYPLEQNASVLVLAPHSDDETLGCGGLLLQKCRRGVSVHVAYVTDGSASHPDHPTLTPAGLAAQRRAEALRAMSLLGMESRNLHFLDARDGTLAHLNEAETSAVIDRIARVLREVQPAEILLPCRHDGSSEHDAAFLLVERAITLTGLRPRVLEFPVWSWWNPLLLIEPLRASRRIWRLDFRGDENLKREALAQYLSQTTAQAPGQPPMLSREFLSFFSSGEEFFFER